MSDLSFNRRQMFQTLIAISAVGGLSACSGDNPDLYQTATYTDGFFEKSEMVLIAALCDTIIPATGTAGAMNAGVPDTLQALATDWGDETYRQYWRDNLAALGVALSAGTGREFHTLSTQERLAVLLKLDSSVFSGEVENAYYRDFKATVIEAYYMSEPGATEELAYELVPGEWIACAPLSDFPKTWAT